MSHFSQLTLNGFKSFSEKTTVRFPSPCISSPSSLPSSFTCIVGPNGSGKSNLIEALCLVLTVPTHKLRATQGRDLLHARGSVSVRCSSVSAEFVDSSSGETLRVTCRLFSEGNPSSTSASSASSIRRTYTFSTSSRRRAVNVTATKLRRILSAHLQSPCLSSVSKHLPPFIIPQHAVVSLPLRTAASLAHSLCLVTGSAQHSESVNNARSLIVKWQSNRSVVEEQMRTLSESIGLAEECVSVRSKVGVVEGEVRVRRKVLGRFERFQLVEELRRAREEVSERQREVEIETLKLADLRESNDKVAAAASEIKQKRRQISEMLEAARVEESDANVAVAELKEKLGLLSEADQRKEERKRQLEENQAQNRIESVRVESSLQGLRSKLNRITSRLETETSSLQALSERIRIQESGLPGVDDASFARDRISALQTLITSHRDSLQASTQLIQQTELSLEQIRQKLASLGPSVDKVEEEISAQQLAISQESERILEGNEGEGGDLTSERDRLFLLEKDVNLLTDRIARKDVELKRTYCGDGLPHVVGTVLELIQLKEEARTYLRALQVIAGPVLDVLVCYRSSEVSAVLDALRQHPRRRDRRNRIWPLDRLDIRSQQQMRERIAQVLGEMDPQQRSKYVRPLDLVCRRSRRNVVGESVELLERVLLRAFGSYLIASTDEAAEVVIRESRGSIRCVTVAGDVHSQGRLSGGSRSSNNPLETLFVLDTMRSSLRKKRNEAEQQHHLVKRLQERQQRQGHLLKRKETIRSLRQQLEQFNLEKSLLMERFIREESSLDAANESKVAAEKSISSTQLDLENYQHVLQNESDAASGHRVLLNSLSREQTTLEESIDNLQASRSSLVAEVCEAEARLEEISEERDVILGRLEEGESEMETGDEDSDLLESRLKLAETDARTKFQERTSIETRLKNATLRLDELKSENREAFKQLSSAKKRVEVASRNLARSEKAIETAETRLSDLPTNRVADSADNDSDTFDGFEADRVEFEAKRLESDLDKLQTRLRSLETDIDMDAVEENRLKMEEFSTSLSLINDALDRLNDCIDQTTHLVRRLNETAFTEISALFTDYFSEMVPGKAATLRKVGELVEEGIEFVVRELRDVPEEEEEEGEGGGMALITGGLSQLSGGQKTLLSLSFIFAIAQYSHPPFYVFDEVDAALDEVNQAVVAEFIQNHFAETQIISVSHNENFQKAASQVIHVEKPGQHSRIGRIVTRRQEGGEEFD